MNNRIILEYFDELSRYRRQTDTLNKNKLDKVIQKYKDYHNKNLIPENRIVYLDKEEIQKLN